MKLRDFLKEGQEPIQNVDFEVLGDIFSAIKKQQMKVVMTFDELEPNSVYQKTDSTESEIVTSINGNTKEAVSKANVGDWIACGVKNEKWVIKSKSFGELYRISGKIATPIQKKFFIKIKTINNISWTNAWNEIQSIPAKKEYYLMANNADFIKKLNWQEINPMDIAAFNATY